MRGWELSAANDHFEFYVFPHTRTALCRESKHVDEPPHPRGRGQEYLLETLLENNALALLCQIGKRSAARIPEINRFITRTLSGSVKTDASHRVFSTRRMVRFTEMEYAVPRARTGPRPCCGCWT